LIGDLVGGVVGRYARLAEAGRIELSTTPHYHPLAPLLLDFHSAREAEAKALLPDASNYPGGRERVTTQLQSALASHARRFGAPPPRHLAGRRLGIPGLARRAERQRSCLGGEQRTGCSRTAWARRITGCRDRAICTGPTGWEARRIWPCFSANDKLSDRIGFEYQKWHGSDAAANFIGELECIAADAPQDERPLVSVILDGENAWEHYPITPTIF